MHTDEANSSGYIRAAGAAQMLDMGISTLWSRSKHDETFPKPLKIGHRTTLFRKADLIAWVEKRATQAAA